MSPLIQNKKMNVWKNECMENFAIFETGEGLSKAYMVYDYWNFV
jgi:hypothetical protein